MAKDVDTDSPVKFDLSEHLPYLFKHIYSQLDVASSGKLAQHGVNVAVWRILAVLWDHDDLSNRELAQLTSIEVSTLSRVSKAVQRDGLIRRKRTIQDQRTVRVTLTEKGKALARTIIPAALELQKDMVEDMSHEELETLKRLLHHVIRNLNKHSEPDVTLGKDPLSDPAARAVIRQAPAKAKRLAGASPSVRSGSAGNSESP